ncbi:PQ-loop-domain-containing protein [Podospora appendiculata]|uniref:PQ-loop-domain-containing protein n=1 Tax=Podospora appendiculata TaxID=314037 RepID=A0AAE0XLL6_9PEZI|nr:PQ-loop-domain-containing protein [Podospora appendiculata]
MASLIATAIMKSPNLGESLSGIFGSVSLTAWICLLLPQLITNYRAKSADALSMKFLFIWLLGDIANLSGALCTDLAPTTIALASYFCFADLVLISQCSYYNAINARRRSRSTERRRHASTATQESDATAISDVTEATEHAPLLRSDSIGLPGSHRRHSMRRRESTLDPLTRVFTGEDDTPDPSPWLHNAMSLVAVWAVGTAGWLVTYKMGAWDMDDSPAGDGVAATEPVAVLGMILGYFSALCYLCARIPQIIKNYQEKSCEGLALLFFLLSLTGNFTYGGSVIAYSQEKDYVIRALPWLIGSLGTMLEDSVIFVQFRLYSPERRQAKTTAVA